MAERDESLLKRWSRLKREQAERDTAASSAEAPADLSAPATVDADVTPAEAEATVRVEDLPDIGSLTYESDFTVFLAKGVPKALRHEALKKLWRSNPVLANLDGLNDHDLDYRHTDIRTLAARSLEDLARGTKRLTASDRSAEPRARPAPASGGGTAPGQGEGPTAADPAVPPAPDPDAV
jgi:hypothetical protein